MKKILIADDHSVVRMGMTVLLNEVLTNASIDEAWAVMLEDWATQTDGRVSGIPTPSFADGLRVQQVIEAARASAQGAGWVPIV